MSRRVSYTELSKHFFYYHILFISFGTDQNYEMTNEKNILTKRGFSEFLSDKNQNHKLIWKDKYMKECWTPPHRLLHSIPFVFKLSNLTHGPLFYHLRILIQSTLPSGITSKFHERSDHLLQAWLKIILFLTRGRRNGVSPFKRTRDWSIFIFLVKSI